MPEIFRKKIDQDSMYAIWKITETIGELEGMIRLRPAEKELYDMFVADIRKKQWLAYRVLLRSLLSPENFPIEYDESGKPYLAGSRSHISVTHSGDMAAVIISTTGLVGIDIEIVKPRIENIKDKFLSPREEAMIKGPEFHALLTLAWCAKESLYKLYGQKGLDFKQNILLNLPGSLKIERFSGEIVYEHFPTRTYTLSVDRTGDYLLVYVIDAAMEEEMKR